MILKKETFKKYSYCIKNLLDNSDKKVIWECPSCEETFIRSFRKTKNLVLCRKCYLLAIKKERKCINCNKNISNKAIRCSDCFQLGKLNPSYIHGRTNNTHCVDCSKKLKCYISKRCKQCYLIFCKIPTNNPRYGKPLPFFTSKYKHYEFRSTWEANFAKWLDLSDIKWTYEPETFNLGYTTYTPDFYLPNFNCWVEIKGWLTLKAKHKIDWFSKKYNLHLFDKNILKNMGVIR